MPWGGRGYRWMYYLTGLPGWMRFGFSPGWGGLPPAAQYLIQTGQVPQFASFLQARAPVIPAAPGLQMSKEDEIRMLEEQAKLLEDQLKQIKKRLEELGGK